MKSSKKVRPPIYSWGCFTSYNKMKNRDVQLCGTAWALFLRCQIKKKRGYLMKRICTHRNKKHRKLPYLGTLKEKPAVRVGLPHILRKK